MSDPTKTARASQFGRTLMKVILTFLPIVLILVLDAAYSYVAYDTWQEKGSPTADNWMYGWMCIQAVVLVAIAAWIGVVYYYFWGGKNSNGFSRY